MTKKDYILIGNKLKSFWNRYKISKEAKKGLINCMGEVFNNDNPNFSWDKWEAFFEYKPYQLN